MSENKEKPAKKASPLPPKMIPWTVKVEVMAPIELTYRVWAVDAHEAIDQIRYGVLVAPPKPILSKQKRIKATVYKYGTSMIEFIKRFT